VLNDVKTIDANGLRFAYLEAGQGPLVMLFHGFPDTAYTWSDVMPKIAAKGYRALAFFMRGYHPTATPTKDADVETLARDPIALLDALGEREAIVVGHDWGYACAYGAAAIAPLRVKKIVVVAVPHPGAMSPTPSLLWGVRHFLEYKIPGAGKRFVANDFAALPRIYRRWSPTWSPPSSEFDAIRACFAHEASREAAFGYYRALTYPVAPCLRKKISVPTVVFAGQGDPIVSPRDYESARKMFTSDYTVEVMPGGHFMHREHPALFAERLLAHL
jgi:pimeloyl-ACP methyl ester carboxylesterase